jgi:hypothetical protein
MFLTFPQDEEGQDVFGAVDLAVKKSRRIKKIAITKESLFSDIVYWILVEATLTGFSGISTMFWETGKKNKINCTGTFCCKAKNGNGAFV